MGRRNIILVVVFVLVAMGASGFVMYRIRSGSILPGAVAKQVNFSVFYPQDPKIHPVDKRTITFNSNSKVLGFEAVVSGKKVLINQQSEPDVFAQAGTDVALYQKLLDKMQQFQDIETGVGTVTLTHPKELNGGEAAVMDEKGTLLFAQPSGNLTTDQWKSFFDSLKVIQQ